MTAYLVLDTGAKAVNIGFTNSTPTEGIRMSGSRSRAERITADGNTAFSAGMINCAATDCHISDVEDGSGYFASVNVTGHRATIRGVTSSPVGSVNGTAVRLSGSIGSAISDVHGYNLDYAITVLNSPNTQATGIYSDLSDLDGIYWEGSNNGHLECVVTAAGQHGLHVKDSSGNRFGGVVVDASKDTTNTYDGVFLEGNSDRNRLGLTVRYGGSGNQMRYGLNISASTCDNNIEASLLAGAGSTGAYNNAGTGTVTTDDHIVS